MTRSQPAISPARVWLLAARPKTLPAALAPVVVGTALAFHDGAFTLLPALAALLGALLLQIGSNFANDYFDFFKGADTADRIGPCWGLGSGTRGDPAPWHGELRNMWKPTAQEALWFHGGNLALSRYYSKFVALQIKARVAGIDTPVYQPPDDTRYAA